MCAKNIHRTMAKNKQRKIESDNEDSIIDVTTNRMVKMKINGTQKLPVVRDIQLVNSDNFDAKKLRLDDEEESGGISRVNLLYKYKNGERSFCFTCPNNTDAFFRCNGVEEETY